MPLGWHCCGQASVIYQRILQNNHQQPVLKPQLDHCLKVGLLWGKNDILNYHITSHVYKRLDSRNPCADLTQGKTVQVEKRQRSRSFSTSSSLIYLHLVKPKSCFLKSNVTPRIINILGNSSSFYVGIRILKISRMQVIQKLILISESEYRREVILRNIV